ncbi:hypothetical protein Amsp01_077870 [Amycolatopsis sp. NBRC 101858]|nr:hypothetical protein Amsp01_077870 [Amycolatopsis sp. NBRC 101858]
MTPVVVPPLPHGVDDSDSDRGTDRFGDRNGRFTAPSIRDHIASRQAIPDWKKRVALFWSVAQRLSEQETFCSP